MPAYMISQVTVTDRTKFESYIDKTKTLAAKYGGEPVAIGTQPKMLNGESDGHQMVFVIQFDSMDVLDSWHSSQEYQALIPLREEGSDQHMVAYEGMALPPS
ncbi:MAG: DUF1330 domain-containing protein [Paracoccaceae bacterium]